MFFFLSLFSLISGKHLASHLILTDNEPWQQIADFGLAIGTGNYTIKARLSTPLKDRSSKVEIQLGLYTGQQWTSALLEKNCEERLQEAKKIVTVELTGNSEWSIPIQGKLIQKNKPHVWYFVLSDCHRRLGTRKIKYEISIMNPENSHFSVEMQGVKSIYSCLLLVLLIALGKNLYSLTKFCRDDEEVQVPVVWLNFSIAFQVLGVLFFYLHLYLYESDGEGISAFNFFGEAFSLISSLSITTLLIMIASGWTITYSEFPMPELYIPAIFLLTFIHLFMAGFGFLHESDKKSFTRYEGTSGMVIIIVRAIMYCWFLVNLYYTSKEKDVKKNHFIYRLGVVSSLYFLAVPLLLIGSNFFQAHYREKVMVAGVNIVQTLAFYSLYKTFMGKGEYYKMNLVFSMLPGSRPHTS